MLLLLLIGSVINVVVMCVFRVLRIVVALFLWWWFLWGGEGVEGLASLDEGSMSILMQATLKQHEQRLLSMDKCWKVPYAWLQACMGQGGQDYLEKAFLKILPSVSVNTSPSEAVQAIRQLAASKLYIFSSRGGQGAVDAGQEMINALVHGFSPSLGKNPSKFITMVWAGRPYFAGSRRMTRPGWRG